MRADVVFRVILNVRVNLDLLCNLRDEKYIEMIACETPPEMSKFLLKVFPAELV